MNLLGVTPIYLILRQDAGSFHRAAIGAGYPLVKIVGFVPHGFDNIRDSTGQGCFFDGAFGIANVLGLGYFKRYIIALGCIGGLRTQAHLVTIQVSPFRIKFIAAFGACKTGQHGQVPERINGITIPIKGLVLVNQLNSPPGWIALMLLLLAGLTVPQSYLAKGFALRQAGRWR